MEYMSDEILWVEGSVNIKAMDNASMSKLADSDYRNYIEELFFVGGSDHALRAEKGGYPFATTNEQLDILIEELMKMKERVISKGDLKDAGGY